MILADSSTITGQSAVLPLLLATFTPTVSGEYFATVNLSLLAGTGVYRLVSTRQIGGVGAIYQSATAAVGVSAGITTLMISTIPTPLLAGDVLKIYVQGLADDTAIDGVTEIFRSDTINEIQSGLALEATLTAIKGAGWTTETLAAIDVLIDAIKAKTDNLPATPASANEYDAELAALQADLDNPDQYKADISGLATKTDVNELAAKDDLTELATKTDLEEIATKEDVENVSILSEVVVGDYDIQDAFKIILAKLVGQATGGETAINTYKGIDGDGNIVVETVDTKGNRLNVVITV